MRAVKQRPLRDEGIAHTCVLAARKMTACKQLSIDKRQKFAQGSPLPANR